MQDSHIHELQVERAEGVNVEYYMKVRYGRYSKLEVHSAILYFSKKLSNVCAKYYHWSENVLGAFEIVNISSEVVTNFTLTDYSCVLSYFKDTFRYFRISILCACALCINY